MKVKCPAAFPNTEENEAIQACVYKWQEIIDTYLKQWGILNEVYHHHIMTHGMVFCSIAVLTYTAVSP